MLTCPQEILRIEPLKSAEIAFQSNLIGNFSVLFLQQFYYFFSYKRSCFIVNQSFIYSIWILHQRSRLQLRVADYQDHA